MELVRPSKRHLPEYVAALQRGWSADNRLGPVATRQELDHIARDADGFLASLVDREAKGEPIVLPDGSSAARLPGYRCWIWDGAFCGSVGLRWQPGTSTLPDWVPGHIGFAVVPWKSGRGYATQALRQMLVLARAEGLQHVDLICHPDNIASQKVVAANGGQLIERFHRLAPHGDGQRLRYRIEL
ncbi:GNAT family N-acetyltransferase [Aquabacterium sp. A7-Y]|uniref:GNAT family N-acetyltransferase n=1 Tax=Aquabacterium sp. A7-Y TaxID=1349605 RepID=UPI00223E1D11|nr:GNAT family N-acetyltransferase [Aquabacterium sp. A7-Y]MCW7539580.1 GNAT family N-acetyltransferase [Aquabacterium sp. A7-Y]